MQTKTTIIAGSFAPPITPEVLARYRALAEAEPAGPVKDALTSLGEMVRVFGQTPRSKLPGKPLAAAPFVGATGPLAGKTFTAEVVPLEPAEVKRIWDHVPWEHEIEGYRKLAKGLKPGPVHDALRHLIWYAAELCKDREPICTDSLKVQ